jgi:hypothetical protein
MNFWQMFDVLSDRLNLTFIFLGRHADDEISKLHPNFLSAARLAIAERRCVTKDGLVGGARRTYDQEEMAQAKAQVQACVKELRRRRGTSFILCWHVDGDNMSHLQCSDDIPTPEKAFQEMVKFLLYALAMELR